MSLSPFDFDYIAAEIVLIQLNTDYTTEMLENAVYGVRMGEPIILTPYEKRRIKDSWKRQIRDLKGLHNQYYKNLL